MQFTFSYYGYVKPVFENVSFSFDTNWKTGLIGRNGIGKSTLFKLLLNQEVYKGKISKSVDFIKFPPNLSDTSKLGIELYRELISDEEEWKLFRELHLLKVDESLIYRKFETLSKGEQTKILLAILFTREDGFLLIDEPTNHLDLESIQALNQGLIQFKENILFTCHDHQFVQTIANRIIEFNKEGIIDRLSTYDEYLEYKEDLENK